MTPRPFNNDLTMTNEELLAKINAEIERMKVDYLNRSYTFVPTAMQQLLDFLSTLEEQTKEVHNPIFDECVSRVDPEVREEVRENIDFEQALYDHFGQVKDFTLGMRIGKYFYELGCRRTAEKYDEIEYNRQREEEKPMNQDELEEEIDRFEDWMETYNQADYPTSFTTRDIARHFAEWQKEQDDRLADIIYQQGIEKGRDDMKEQMLKKAVEADVMLTLHDKTGDISLHTGYLPKELGIKYGDKVKIIIVKED